MCNDQSIPSELLDKFKLLVDVVDKIYPHEFDGKHEFTSRYDFIIDGLRVLLSECAILIHQYDPNSSIIPRYITSVTVFGKKITLLEPIRIYYNHILSGLLDQDGNSIYFHIAKNVGYNITTVPKETQWEAFQCAQYCADYMARAYGLGSIGNPPEPSKEIRELWRKIWSDAIGSEDNVHEKNNQDFSPSTRSEKCQ